MGTYWNDCSDFLIRSGFTIPAVLDLPVLGWAGGALLKFFRWSSKPQVCKSKGGNGGGDCELHFEFVKVCCLVVREKRYCQGDE